MTRAGIALGLMVTCAGVVGLAGGCTRESLRVALETQHRADQVQQAVFDRQHEALCILLYRDLQRRLAETGTMLSDAQRAALNAVWNDRDLVEFWALQQERAAALRLAGVDAKLYADQSAVDLLWKSLETKWSQARHGLAAAVVERAVAGAEAARPEVRHE